jgi:hypothetical protein
MTPRKEEEPGEFDFLIQPEKSVRTYDSTLSKPGKLCGVCRTFVPGGAIECNVCWTMV